jgi:hypothetical protein
MEKHPNPFDDFLKETLKGHQLVPSAKAKKDFLEEASAIMPAGKSWLKWYYIPLLVIFISGIIAFFYFQNSPGPVLPVPVVTENHTRDTIRDSSTNASKTTSTLTSSSTLTSTSSSSSLTENQPVISESAIPVKNNTVSENKSSFPSAEVRESHDADKSEPVVITGDLLKDEVPVAQSVLNDKAGNDDLSYKTISTILAFDSISTNVTRLPDSALKAGDPDVKAIPVEEPESKDIPGQERAEMTPYFTAGVYYLPEWMFNTIENNKFVSNFGFDATFYRGPISIRTGAGISVSKGITKNSVEYNDYLGTYNKLDSITFVFNEAEHDFMPNLFMSSQKVWDSIQKYDSADVIKRYTYLQVPLVLGFDFWQRGSFTAGVRIGTIMSVLLNSKQLSGEYDPGEDQVLGINRISPEQVSINWQALGGFNASVKLTEDFYIEIEPQVKYYYQSIYEKSDMTEKPWSVGVRTTVVYKFK